MIATGLIVACGILFAVPLVTLFAGDYAEVEGKFELTVRLTRVLFPFLMLVAVAVALMGMLNSLQKFFVPALSPATALTLVGADGTVDASPTVAEAEAPGPSPTAFTALTS